MTEKNKVYRCPYNCGTPGYPKPKWKTEKGYKKHIETCHMRPQAVQQRADQRKEKELRDQQVIVETLKKCEYKIGDTIHYCTYSVTHPTHINGRKVRYEEKRRYYSARAIIDSIEATSDGCLFFNQNRISKSDICDSEQSAKTKAEESQKSHEEHLAFSSFCR